MREILYFDAMKEALAEEMRREKKVYMIGESIRGGNFPHTDGLVQEFGNDRIMDTPLAETALAGIGIGSALTGYRPVVEMMFADFLYVAADEVFHKAAQWRFLHGGQTSMPVVFMASAGGGDKLANEHSKLPSAMVLHHPGLKLAVPSNPYDAKGLLKTAIRDDNPVCYFWHLALMAMPGEIPDEEYTVPFGVAEVKREGSDITVLAISNMVNLALEVAEKLAGKISVEVIDPRTLEPFDMEAVVKSVEKTGHLVIVDEDTENCGFAAELGFRIQDKIFDELDAPVKRVCGANYPIAGGYLEQHVLPKQEQILKAIEDTLA